MRQSLFLHKQKKSSVHQKYLLTNWNEVNEVDGKLIRTTTFWLEGIIQTIVAIFGIIGNLIAVIIFWSGMCLC